MVAPRREGLTLIELLVVVAILGALLALVLPATQGARESARRTQCVNRLRQLALATDSFASARSEYPPGVEQRLFPGAVIYRGVPLFAFLLPYLEGASVVAEWDTEDPINNLAGGPLSRTAVVLPELVCPSDAIQTNPITFGGRDWVYALTSYGGNGGSRSYFPSEASADGVFHTTGEASEPKPQQTPVRPSGVTDGMSHTVLFGERSHEDNNYQTFADQGWGDRLDQWGWWGASASRKIIGHVTLSAYAPLNDRLPFRFEERQQQSPPANSMAAFAEYVDRRLSAFGSSHPGGANFSFADGGVRFVATGIDPGALRAACTRSAGD